MKTTLLKFSLGVLLAMTAGRTWDVLAAENPTAFCPATNMTNIEPPKAEEEVVIGGFGDPAEVKKTESSGLKDPAPVKSPKP
jgi:hypothetical protein